VLYRPRSNWTAIGWAVVMFLCGMTEIQIVIFIALIPFCFSRARRKALPIFVAVIASGAWQIITTLTTPRQSHPAWPGIPSLVQGYFINTVLPMVNVSPALQAKWLMSSGIVVPALVATPFLAAAILVLVIGSNQQRVLILALVAGSFAVYAAAVIVDGTAGVQYADNYGAGFFHGYLDLRYGVTSGIFLAGLIPVAAAVLVARYRGRRPLFAWGTKGLGVAAISTLIILFALVSTHAGSIRFAYNAWSFSVGEAAGYCQRLPGDRLIALPVAPFRQVSLTCKQVLAYSG
jgi:hypothetical protein